jgi:pimeloyl-ACP methyl ester carboxylesterase
VTGEPVRPTVLALSGLLCDEQVWRAQADALSDLAHFVIVDFPDLDDFGDMAEHALSLVDGPFHLWGYSMGGRVALEVWRRAAGRVRSLVLFDTAVHGVRAGEAEGRQELVELSAAEGMAATADAWLPPMVDPARWNDVALMGRLRAMVLRATPEQHARQIHALVTRDDQTPILATIDVPTLLAVGRQDAWSPVAQHEEMAAAIAGARLEVIEDAGHFSTIEQPDVVTALLREWQQGLATTVRRR